MSVDDKLKVAELKMKLMQNVIVHVQSELEDVFKSLGSSVNSYQQTTSALNANLEKLLIPFQNVLKNTTWEYIQLMNI